MMDEMITVYYVAYTVFLCLSSIQIVVCLVKDWHKHIRSSRQKRSKRKWQRGLASYPQWLASPLVKTPWAMPCGSSYNNYSLTSWFLCVKGFGNICFERNLRAVLFVSGRMALFICFCCSFVFICYTSILFATLRLSLRGFGHRLVCAALPD